MVLRNVARVSFWGWGKLNNYTKNLSHLKCNSPVDFREPQNRRQISSSCVQRAKWKNKFFTYPFTCGVSGAFRAPNVCNIKSYRSVGCRHRTTIHFSAFLPMNARTTSAQLWIVALYSSCTEDEMDEPPNWLIVVVPNQRSISFAFLIEYPWEPWVGWFVPTFFRIRLHLISSSVGG